MINKIKKIFSSHLWVKLLVALIIIRLLVDISKFFITSINYVHIEDGKNDFNVCIIKDSTNE